MFKRTVKIPSAYTSIIYKADQRAVEAKDQSKTFRTFNDHSQAYPFRQPFGDLLEMNDVFLAPGQQMHFTGEHHEQQFILPVSGMLQYNDGGARYKPLHPEQVMCPDNKDIIIKNTGEKETINFLHWRLKKNMLNTSNSHVHDLNFSDYDQLVSINPEEIDDDCYGAIGIYKGRTKATYKLHNPGNGLFVFVINGSFEVEDRLMEHRDGLAIWEKEEIEFESLSELAIVLLLEQKR